MASNEHLDYLKTINNTFYDQIKAADQKAAYILTFLFVLLIWSSDMRQVFFWVNIDKGLSLRWVLSLLQVVALAVALVSAILVLLPRDKEGGGALYWNAWPQARQALDQALQSDDKNYVTEQYLNNVANLSALCRRKYRMVGLAFRGLICALVFHVLMLVAV